jgi:hypothetical protein
MEMTEDVFYHLGTRDGALNELYFAVEVLDM